MTTLIEIEEQHCKIEHFASIFLAAQMSNVLFHENREKPFSDICRHAMRMGAYFVEISEDILKEKLNEHTK